MGFAEKNASFIRLQKEDHLEADRRHLVRLNPKSPVLDKRFFDRDKERKEILYALLDHATEEQILADRSGKKIVVTNKGQKIQIQKKKSKHHSKKRKAR